MTGTQMTQNRFIYYLMKYDIIEPRIRTHNDKHRSTADNDVSLLAVRSIPEVELDMATERRTRV